jgi:hypothetical protein
MNRGNDLTTEPELTKPQLSEGEALIHRFYGLAQTHKEDAQELLKLLRELERLHQSIRDDFFQKALPSNRRALYSLLRDIEAEGGWPYIPRMKLQTLLDQAQDQPLPSAEEA